MEKIHHLLQEKVIIVTGAAGFIGSAVVRHLNNLGFENLLLVDDIEKTEKWKNLLGKKFSDFISKHDLFPWLEERVAEVGGIIHLGACSDTLEKDGDYLMENNFRYTQLLAEIALHHDIRFIYASSAATYGDGSLGLPMISIGLKNFVLLIPMDFLNTSSIFGLNNMEPSLRLSGLNTSTCSGPTKTIRGTWPRWSTRCYPK